MTRVRHLSARAGIKRNSLGRFANMLLQMKIPLSAWLKGMKGVCGGSQPS